MIFYEHANCWKYDNLYMYLTNHHGGLSLTLYLSLSFKVKYYVKGCMVFIIQKKNDPMRDYPSQPNKMRFD